MRAKVVVHVDQEEENRILTALGNIENLLKEIPSNECDIRMVTHSSAVRLLRKDQASNYAARVKELSERDVRFLVCNNSLSKLGIDRSELLDVCEVVPAGIVELVSLQHQGFAYVKP